MFSKAKTGLILSISGLFELSKQFSGVGFNFPADKDISDSISGSYSLKSGICHLDNKKIWILNFFGKFKKKNPKRLIFKTK